MNKTDLPSNWTDRFLISLWQGHSDNILISIWRVAMFFT